MKKIGIAVLLCAAMVLPAIAGGDKDYVDGKLTRCEKYKPNWTDAVQATAAGQIGIEKSWNFFLHIGDFDYHAIAHERKLGSADEFPADGNVKVRIEIKGGGIATRTFLHIKKTDGKDVEVEVLSIKDANGNEYCGKRKCDPKSAEKKMKEGDK